MQKLTGQDFDYNIPAWREWMSREYNPTPKAVAQGSPALNEALLPSMIRQPRSPCYSDRRPRP